MAFAAIFLLLTTQYLFSVPMACTNTSNTLTHITNTHTHTYAHRLMLTHHWAGLGRGPNAKDHLK